MVGWTNAGTNTSIALTGLSLTHNQSYYFSVIATNGAGGDSLVGSSDGITVDATPPTTPVVTDDGASQTSHDTLHATWTSTDPESGLAKYEYCIGHKCRPDGCCQLDRSWVRHFGDEVRARLQEGSRYYISVRATNTVGLVSEVGSSDGVLD